MDPTEGLRSEDFANFDAPWATPTSQCKQRPATIHGGFGFSFCFAEDHATMPSWDASSTSLQQTPSDIISRPASMQQEHGHANADHESLWLQKPCSDSLDLDLHGLDPDMHIGQAFTSDEAIPILDLKQSSPLQDTDALQRLEGSYDPRRISGSSFTMSTSGGMSDMPSYEEFSAALSEVPSFGSEYPPPSNRTSLLSSTQLSPMPSPRLGAPSRYDFVRAQSRGRGASPSPRPSIRTAPYSVESSRNNKRWSTGSYGTQHGRQGSPFRCHGHGGQDGLVTSQPIHGSYWLTSQPPLQNGGMLLPPQGPPRISSMLPHEPPTLPSQPLNPDVPQRLDTSSSLLSRDLFKILQRNSNLGTLHGHYANLSDPPNLFASLHEEQVPPPPEDMEPEDPVMTPHEQELRFPGDLYTPHWVRGHGNKREGWCGICKPGRWLVLKNSAFWYDKSFSHGISAGTGSPFQEPQDTRRMEGNPDVWEGLCGGCSDWIALVSSKKKGTTWFRHAYKCHAHHKAKDGSKRRREGVQAKPLAASTMPEPKRMVEVRSPEKANNENAVNNTSTTHGITPLAPASEVTTYV